jgi:hypothetical protein
MERPAGAPKKARVGSGPCRRSQEEAIASENIRDASASRRHLREDSLFPL